MITPTEKKVLRAMAAGPCSRVDIKKVLGWDLWVDNNKSVDRILRRLQAAGLVEPGNRRRGEWQLREGVEICPECSGCGVLKTVG